jgi:hypothetical protein
MVSLRLVAAPVGLEKHFTAEDGDPRRKIN